MKLNRSEFSEQQILAMAALTASKYKLSLDEVKEDPVIWNSLIRGIIFQYATSEIARDIAMEQDFSKLTDEDRAKAQQFYDDMLGNISAMGNDPDEFLKKMGFTEESMMSFSEDQVYRDKLSTYWAQSLELDEDQGKANYQILMNFDKRGWEEIAARESSGAYYIDYSSLLLPEE